MTPKQQLIEELETAPVSVLPQVLDFLRYLKSKKAPSSDVMQFAGMAADIPDVIDEIIADVERNRQLGLRQENEA